MLRRDYVDDGFGGGTEADVDRLMGEVVDQEGGLAFKGTVPAIMAMGNFTIKYMIRSGEARPEVLEQYGGKVLGTPWNPAEDTMALKFQVNLSARRQKVYQGEPLTIYIQFL